MKKLLITTMAAASLAFCAKAEFISGTSFEEFDVGAEISQDTTEGPGNLAFWSTNSVDGLFVVTNLDAFGSIDANKRPEYWKNSGNSKVLFIDSDKPLARNINARTASDDGASTHQPVSFADAPIFFDSVVQFTATETPPTPGDGDKLIVWLYADESNEANATLGTAAGATNLIVTAASIDDNGKPNGTKHFIIEGVNVLPDSWHRLTIKSQKYNASVTNGKIDIPAFDVYINGDLVSGKADGDSATTTKFPSLVGYEYGDSAFALTAVAFDGKGAVDDLVFTTTDPFPQKTATVAITFSDLNALDEKGGAFLYVNEDDEEASSEHEITTASTNIVLFADDVVRFEFAITDGYTLTSPTSAKLMTDDEGYNIYEITLDALTADGAEINIVTASGDTPEDTTKYQVAVNAPNATVAGIATDGYEENGEVEFTVKANIGYEITAVTAASESGDITVALVSGAYSFKMPAEAVTITVTTQAKSYPYPDGGAATKYTEAAMALIDGAFVTMPETLTVVVNGETLLGDAAVDMINDVAKMFTGNPFDAKGKLELSFTVTDVMKAVLGGAEGYTLEVGAATLNKDAYEVVPEFIDLATGGTLGSKPETGAVIFKLKIQEKAAVTK